jgi:choline dehydrogenase-like flavoprotein
VPPQCEEGYHGLTGRSWHETCTGKMGRDEMSVVDSGLQVYGVENVRIADGSIMPRITTANAMAPCVIIGERAAEILRRRHNLSVHDMNDNEEVVSGMTVLEASCATRSATAV